MGFVTEILDMYFLKLPYRLFFDIASWRGEKETKQYELSLVTS